MRRREFIALVGSMAAWPPAARAQSRTKIPRVGYLGLTSPTGGHAPFLQAFREALTSLGYTEGVDLVIEYRWADGHYDRLLSLALELVRMDVDLIVAQATPGSMAAKQATATIPVVMLGVSDAVNAGLVRSLARPEGNITGLQFFFAELCAKRLELLRELLPRAKRSGVLLNPNNSTYLMALETMQRTAAAIGLELRRVEVRASSELENAFALMVRERMDAITVIEEPVLNSVARQIGELAATSRLAMAGGIRDNALGGAVLSYGVDFRDLWRRGGALVDKIIKGAYPSDLPVEQATKFALVLNLRTAKALDITVPPTLLARADEVIE